MKPSRLPKVRDQVLAHLDDPDSNLRSKTSDALKSGLDAVANHLRAAGLYWVAPDMAALAVSSGGQLAAARWATADRPSPCGLMVWDGGIGALDADGYGGTVPIPVHACTWGPYEREMLLFAWSRRDIIAAEVAHAYTLDYGAIPPLMPVAGWTLPITGEPVAMAELDAGMPTFLPASVAAAWLLMEQPTLVDRQNTPVDKNIRSAYGRNGRPQPDVTLVDLRRQYVPQDGDASEGIENGRRFRNRWVVSGHWRDQPHGPERSLRRKQWIPAHIKGPDGAPMLATERVNVWRR